MITQDRTTDDLRSSGRRSSFVMRFTREEYDAYMLSPEWRDIRTSILLRAKGRCERCKKKRSCLEVHHKHYDNFRCEKPEDLMALCSPCHKKEDKVRKRRGEWKNWESRVRTWMDKDKTFGCSWPKYYTFKQAEKKFLKWARSDHTVFIPRKIPRRIS